MAPSMKAQAHLQPTCANLTSANFENSFLTAPITSLWKSDTSSAELDDGVSAERA